MRRGVALFISLSAIAWLTPSLSAQYPYPYGPPVYRMPAQMPMPMPAPMPYGYYPPAQLPYGYQAPPAPAPRVYVYGPLTDGNVPVPAKLPDAVTVAPPAPAVKPAVTSAQDTSAPGKDPAGRDVVPASKRIWPALPASSSALLGHSESSCGPEGCGDDGSCLSCIPRDPPMHGHGHFFADVGALIFVPYPSQHNAYTSTLNGGTASFNDFPRGVDAGPIVNFGYLCHNGWGFRADYWYLTGSTGQTASNAAVNNVIGTPLGTPFQFTSPSMSLAAGVGSDQYTFSQSLNVNVADAEVIRELQWMDTTFLFGAGVRYARISQSYSASQVNNGGANGAVVVGLDRQDADASNVFQGWGPTICLEAIHALPRSCFSIYGNIRGSFLWGTDDFTQSLHTQNRTVTGGVPSFVDTINSRTNLSTHESSICETEFGLQYGRRCGPCYVFIRAGADFQRWWNVGSPTSANGNISFIGGVARVGVTY